MSIEVKRLVFQPCNRAIILFFFLPPYVTSVVQPLDQGIIVSFKVHFKNKLLEQALSQFDSSTTHHDSRNIVVPHVRHDIMWCFQAWRDMNLQIIQNNWRMSKI